MATPAWPRFGALLSLALALGCTSVEDERELRFEKAKYYFDEGMEFVRQGETEQALESFTNALEEHPQGYSEAHFQRANCHRRLGHVDEAITDYTAALHLSPGFDQALYNRAGMFVQKEMWREALRDWLEYHQGNPADAGVLRWIGYVFYQYVPSKRREALDYFHRYLSLVGKDERVEAWVVQLEAEFGPLPAPSPSP